jgi:cytochrome P450
MADEAVSTGIGSTFDPHDREFRRGPFTFLRTLREHAPLAYSERYGGFWVASTYQEVLEAARDPATFSSAQGVLLPPTPLARPFIPMEADPPAHTTYRRILHPRFSARAVSQFEDDVRSITTRLIDGFVEKGQADLGDFSALIPLQVITWMLGVDPDADAFRQWEHWIIHERTRDPAAAAEAEEALYEFFEAQIDERRRSAGPRDDLIGMLLAAEAGGSLLGPDDVTNTAVFLLLAGLDNTAFAIWSCLWHLVNDVTLRQRARLDPTLIPPIGEELLRLYAPVPGLARTLTRDVDWCGQRLRASERVLLLWASANRDEGQFSRPDDFVMGREVNTHLAFGTGIHRCLGAPLARLEMRVAVEEVLRRIPDYRIAEGAQVEWSLGKATSLPAVFTPRPLDTRETRRQ